MRGVNARAGSKLRENVAAPAGSARGLRNDVWC
jgi:hypothetical protein